MRHPVCSLRRLSPSFGVLRRQRTPPWPGAPAPWAAGFAPAALCALALLCAPALPAVCGAQSVDETSLPGVKIMEFNAGDLDVRTYGYAYVRMGEVAGVVFLPPEALSATVYQQTATGGPGWLRLASDRGWNSFAFELVGGGKSLPPTTSDLVRLTDKALYGVSQSGLATQAVAVFAPGVSAAFVIKAQALDPQSFQSAILLDPLGPRGSTSPLPLSADALVARRRPLDDRLWVEWALGPRPGKLAKHSDLGRDGCAKVISWVERDQPQFWASAVTGFDSVLEVREAAHLKGWPVLILRSPGRTPEQIAREDELAAWLSQQGARVERRALVDVGGPGISALPMCGAQAPVVLDALLQWAAAYIPPDRELRPAQANGG